MALDFHRLENKEYLFCLHDKQFESLIEIFDEFKYRTGFIIDQYRNFKVTIENQKTLIDIIDKYLEGNNLNKDKFKTVTIVEFRTLLVLYSNKSFELYLKGD